MAEQNTISKFLDGFASFEMGLDGFDTKKAVSIVLEICEKIPANGEYDPAIIGDRIGMYVYGIQECGKLLASLGLIEKYQKTEVDKKFSFAALEKAPQKGYTTDGKAKLYAQMDDEYILARNKLNEIQAVMSYIGNYRESLELAHLHCKKILDRNSAELRIAKEHERFSITGNKEGMNWTSND